MSPISISDFAKYIGRHEVFALPFDDFCRLIRANGFYLTVSGLVPKNYDIRKAKR